MKKTWQERYNSDKPEKVKILEKRFADLPEGTKMFIATPRIIDDYIRDIPYGVHVDLKTMRKDIALVFHADNSCPVTTGIFLRIVAEFAYEKYKKGDSIDQITPFWRVVSTKMPIVEKLQCGVDFVIKQRKKEGII